MNDTILERRKVVKEILSKQGLTIKEWSIRHGVSATLVNAVINGKASGRINKGHKIAVLLGIKEGEILKN